MASSSTLALPEASTTINQVSQRITGPSPASGKLTDVETIRVVLLDLIPLRLGVVAGKGNVRVGRLELLGQVHLGTARSSDGQLRDTSELPWRVSVSRTS